jgi:hypothetical protein
MTDKLQEIPTFANEDEERAFWATHDSTEYIDWDKGKEAVLPLLNPSTRTITTRQDSRRPSF